MDESVAKHQLVDAIPQLGGQTEQGSSRAVAVGIRRCLVQPRYLLLRLGCIVSSLDVELVFGRHLGV